MYAIDTIRRRTTERCTAIESVTFREIIKATLFPTQLLNDDRAILARVNVGIVSVK